MNQAIFACFIILCVVSSSGLVTKSRIQASTLARGLELQLVPSKHSVMLKSRSGHEIGDNLSILLEGSPIKSSTPISGSSVDEVAFIDDQGKDTPRERSSVFWRGCVVALCFVWATQFAVAQKIFEETSGLEPSTYAAVRFSLAAVALLPTYAKYLGDLEFVKDCFLIGFLVFIAFVGQSTGIKMGAASDKVAFIASLTVVWVPIQKAFQTKNFKDQKWTSVLLAIVGIAMLELEGTEPPGLKDLWAFLQPIGFGSSLILLETVAKKRKGDRESGAAVAGLRALGIAVPCIAWAASQGALDMEHVQPLLESSTAQLGILYLGLFTTAGMWYLQTFVTPNVKAQDFSLILAVEPIFATLISVFLLGESIGNTEILGGLLVTIACIAADVSLVPPSENKEKKKKKEEEETIA